MSCRAMSWTPTSASTLFPNPQSTRTAVEARLHRSLRSLRVDNEEKASCRSFLLHCLSHHLCFDICLEPSLEASLWLLLRLLGSKTPPDKTPNRLDEEVTCSKPRLKPLSHLTGCLYSDVGCWRVCGEENEREQTAVEVALSTHHIIVFSFTPPHLFSLLFLFFLLYLLFFPLSRLPRKKYTKVKCLLARLFLVRSWYQARARELTKRRYREREGSDTVT